MTDSPNDGTAGSGQTPPKRPRQGTTKNPRVKRSTKKPPATGAAIGASHGFELGHRRHPDTRDPDPRSRPADRAAAAWRRTAPRRGSRYLPAFLSSIIPGLGQLVTGRRTLAALFLFPVVILIVGVLVALVIMGPARLAASLIEPEVIWSLLGLQVLFIVWRLLAMSSSVLDPAYPKPRARDIVPIGLLILFIVVPAGLRARGHRPGAPDGGHRLRRRRLDRRCLGPGDRRADLRHARLHRRGRCAADRRVALPDGWPAARQRPPRRGRLRAGPEHLPDRHDDRGLARPGRRHRLDGLHPARHGRRAAAQRPDVRRQDQLAGLPTRDATRASSRAPTAGASTSSRARSGRCSASGSTTTRSSTCPAS